MDGEWSIYIEDLKREKVTIINDKQMVAASLIKLFTAGTYLNEVKEGNVMETPRSTELLELMISKSDNDAWEDLEKYIGNGIHEQGINKVNAFIEENGYKESGRLIGANSIFSEDAKNLSSVKDIGNVLHAIYNNTYVDEAASKKLLDCMLNQERITKIPSGLPEGVKCANKTGELEDTQNDAAIVYADNTDYILVIFTQNQIYYDIAVSNISEVSKIVYEYMTQINEE